MRNKCLRINSGSTSPVGSLVYIHFQALKTLNLVLLERSSEGQPDPDSFPRGPTLLPNPAANCHAQGPRLLIE